MRQKPILCWLCRLVSNGFVEVQKRSSSPDRIDKSFLYATLYVTTPPDRIYVAAE
jgi:hypothetical protein